jgi:uncharacterized membrane protein
MKTRLAAARAFAAALLLAPVLAAPAAAADGGGAVFAAHYWEQFVDYWRGVFMKQNGIVMGVLGVGVIALFIITRGKWRK